MRQVRVVVFPGIAGEDRLFMETMAAAIPNRDFETIRYPGPLAASDLLMDLRTTAVGIASRMTVPSPTLSLVLIGYSYGGNLAYEVAQCLFAQGGDVVQLILIDPALPNTSFRLLGNLPAHQVTHASAPTIIYALRPIRTFLIFLALLLPNKIRKKLTRRILYDLRVYARRTWAPRTTGVKVLHIVSHQLAPVVSKGWADLCPRIRQVTIAGSHINIWSCPRRWCS
ncbi:thioesterase domain-containing protein [Methylobacterium sp. J-090]|uniref:thioesterase domain-containing protein n=1 Tax=Methylobacterium sp. J-090 TaxID=2836666 RepID=UPI001FBA7367|nr:thioesterase domain-containing protein [Methylobacterium sp. J-090]MCJ2082822.1 thioesterase domain-containing protein [Methylobacterium sp. J-090]